MEVLRGIEGLPVDDAGTAVTIGFFDGVHRGHQAVIRRTVDVARDRPRDSRRVAHLDDEHGEVRRR